MSEALKTVLYEKHTAARAKMVEFGGWMMPLQYTGIIEEHLATRKKAGLFDVSHMGRFSFTGAGATAFLQHVLTNNAAALDPLQAQYTIIPDSSGGAVDDAYLYRFFEDGFILVVNAANARKDWEHFSSMLKDFGDVKMSDRSEELAMLSLQGPLSRQILEGLLESGRLPEPMRNELGTAKILGKQVLLARTGYTGEPVCFELFVERNSAAAVWDALVGRGAVPVGLGARDTLRLESALPLYGHELGLDPEGRVIPVFACPLSRFAVSFSPLKGEFIGKKELLKQFGALKKIIEKDYSSIKDLPRLIQPLAMTDRGIARPGCKVFSKGKHAGFVTSGTSVPFLEFENKGTSAGFKDEKFMRNICLALIDSDIREDDAVEVEIRDKKLGAVVVPFHMRSEAPPYARPINQNRLVPKAEATSGSVSYPEKAYQLLDKTVLNTVWRQKECINLIPSEMTLSPMTRLLSVMDPAFRYAEHKQVKAFYDEEVFYYQGVDFIREVEELLKKELCAFLGCRETEPRLISGQLANTVVFSALTDYVNRADAKSEPRRLRCAMNNHIIRGGHLSSQPMGALKDFVARDPRTEKPAVVNFPVLADNPYKMDVAACRELIARYRPELLIFGKSMVLHTEPVAEIRSFVDEQKIKCVIMYDMAHVLGLCGPRFQEPFKEGADIVTGSTHKTFFGTQRGVIASDYKKEDENYKFWETIQRRTFPGALSNHHLGTMVGLLMAAYEMNYFKDEYQKKVLANAKAFAKALHDAGLDVAGDPSVSYTQTHQVIINVGYAKGMDLARALEDNNIILNYQSTPDEEGFTASGALRTGVSEMTRFGMEEKDFGAVAQLVRDALAGKKVKEEVKALRRKFPSPRFCFTGTQFDSHIEKLHKLI